MKYIKTITIDISKKIYETIETKSKDTARYLLFKLLDNGVPFDLTSKTVRAYSSSKKLNDLVIVEAERGLCELKLTSGFLLEGVNKLELVIYEGLDILSTMLFEVNNIACLRDDSAIEATNEFSALTVALNKVGELDNRLKNKVDKVAGKSLSTNDYTNEDKKEVEKIKNKVDTSALLDKIYPVGSIYISTADTNPSEFLGGTWQKFAEGRTLVGASSTDTDFSAGKTGGEKKHTITEAELPRVYLETMNRNNTGSEDGYGYVLDNSGKSKWESWRARLNGGGQAHNNLQPFIAVYMWTRSA